MTCDKREFTLFGNKRTFPDLEKEYNQKLSHLEKLITPQIYQFNSDSEEWDTEEGSKRTFDASVKLAALFSEQNDLEGNAFELNAKSLAPQINATIVQHGLNRQNLEISNQNLFQALHQLIPKLKMPNDITAKQAKVAIEVMDVITDALNGQTGNNQTKDPKKTLTKGQLIHKLNDLGKQLENNGFTGTFPIVLGIVLCIVSLITLGVLFTCLVVPGFGQGLCTILGLTASLDTAAIPYFASFYGIAIGFLSIVIGGIILPDATKSPDSNPELAEAILDVAHNWDLEPAQMTTPLITG